MQKDKQQLGFTLIETLIVVAMITILLALAGGISSKFAERRAVDDTANRITSELNLIKLQAARDGVQYRTTINFDEDESNITIEKRRGDSNRTSAFGDNTIISEEDYSIKADYIMDDTEYILDFNPNGTAVAAQTMILRPTEDSSVTKCARIQVTQFGVIRTLIGRWNFDTAECDLIVDAQAELEGES